LKTFEGIELFKKFSEFNGIYWTCQALSKYKDLRPHVKHLNIKNGEFTATDGSRIHHYKSELDIKDGFYSVPKLTAKHIILAKAGDNIKYPEFEDLFIVPNDAEKVQVYQDSWNCYAAFASIVRLLSEDATLNYKYLVEMIGNDCWDAFVQKDEKRPIIFKLPKKIGLLMPMRR
jgi:hypothetical protein